MATKKEVSKKIEKITPLKEVVKKTAASANAKKVSTPKVSLSVPVYSLAGKAAGSMELPKEIFGVKVNNTLLAQAMRVYLNNQKSHFASTKTRGEVVGSTRKIYKQKGTGRARHGAVSAPIFVHGGIALGPKYRKVTLELPKKMKARALLSALSQKLVEKAVFGVTGLEKHTGKTKEMAQFIRNVNGKDQKLSTLILTGGKVENAQRAARNITGVNLVNVDQVNVLEVIKHQSLLFTKDAIEKLQERITKVSQVPQGENKKPRGTSKKGAVK